MSRSHPVRMNAGFEGITQPSEMRILDLYIKYEPPRLPLGKHSGRHALARACAALGVDLAGDALDAAFRRFKERADAGGVVHLEELFEQQEVVA